MDTGVILYAVYLNFSQNLIYILKKLCYTEINSFLKQRIFISPLLKLKKRGNETNAVFVSFLLYIDLFGGFS